MCESVIREKERVLVCLDFFLRHKQMSGQVPHVVRPVICNHCLLVGTAVEGTCQLSYARFRIHIIFVCYDNH